jgi:hypothetical protein
MRALRIAELAMFDMTQEDSPPPDDLYSALRDIVYRPVKTLVPPWSWKAAALSALLRGITFFVGNLRSGHRHALQAMMVEAVFCDFRRRTHRCGLAAITGFTADLGDRGYCLSRTTRPDGGGAAWRTPCRTHTPGQSARILLLRSRFLHVQLVCDAPWGIARRHRSHITRTRRSQSAGHNVEFCPRRSTYFV